MSLFSKLFKKQSIEKSIEKTLEKAAVPTYLETKIERVVSPLPENIEIIDRYQAGYNKMATVTIYRNVDTDVYVYHIEEPPISPIVENLYRLVRERFQSMEMVLPEKITERELVYEKYIMEVLKELGYEDAYTKYPELRYYLIRDLSGWRIIDVPMRDPRVEELDYSNANSGLSVVVKHDKVQSTWVDTNVVLSEDELLKLIEFIAFKTGKQISVSQPILEARTPEGYRVAANLRDVGMSPAFTIRKFPENPLSLTMLIKNKTMSPLLAAYLWTLVENMRFILVIGGMATGKSLVESELVLAKINQEISLLTFGKLWEVLSKYVKPSTLSEMEVLDLSNVDVEVLTLTKSGVAWKKPKYLIRHRVSEKLVKIKTKTGRELVVTKDHSLLVWKVGNEKERFAVVVAVAKPTEIFAKQAYLPYLRKLDLENTNVSGRIADPRFGYLVGFFVAEGYFNGSNILAFHQAVGNVLDTALRYMDELGIQYRIVPEKRKPHMRYITVYDADFKRLVADVGEKARFKRVPDVFWNMPEEWRLAFLAGVIDGDGGVHAGKHIIEIAVASRELAYGLLYAFASVGVHAYIRERRVKKYPDRVYYRVFVPIGANRDELAKIARYLSEEKRKLIEEAVAKSGNHHSETDIIPAEIAHAIDTQFKRLEHGRNEELGEKLYDFIPRGVGFDRVESIEEVDYDGYVYDLEVPETENFEANGIFVHNTTVLQAIASVIPRDRKVVCVAPGTMVATNKPAVIDTLFEGTLIVSGNIESVEKPVKILAYRDGKVFWTVSEKVHRIHIPRDIKLRRIVTEFGTEVTVTPNTLIPVLTPEGIRYKRASDVELGDLVPQLAFYEPQSVEVKDGYSLEDLPVAPIDYVISAVEDLLHRYDTGKELIIKADAEKVKLLAIALLRLGVVAYVDLRKGELRVSGHEYERLKDVLKRRRVAKDREYIWARVVSVEDVDHDGIVYDLTPRDAQYFFAGNGGFIVVEDTIEDTPELRLDHPRWQALYTRRSVYGTEQDVTLFDLARYSLRTRGQYIIIGEVRDREIQTLVQMAASGHGSLCLAPGELVRVRINRKIEEVPIGVLVEKVLAGEIRDVEVLSIDLASRRTEWKRVKRVYKVPTNEWIIIYMSSGATVKTTPDHRFPLASGRIVRAGELKPGDALLVYVDGNVTTEKIVGVEREVLNESEWSYDIEVEDNHTFLVNGYVFTMNCTFHAEDPETLFLRLTSPPLSVQPSFLLTIAAVVLQQRIWSRKYRKFVRRTSKVWEITGLKPTVREGEIPVTYKEVFVWDPVDDYHYPDNEEDLVKESRQIQIIAKSTYGEDEWYNKIVWELREKRTFLEQLVAEGVFDFKEVTERIYRKSLEIRQKV